MYGFFFFFDNQIRRYLVQFMRIFSDIKVRNGPDANGLYTIQRVPIMYGDPSWMVAQIIKGASENTALPSPMFSVSIENIKMVPERRQDTQYVGKVSTVEREFDKLTQTYGTGPGVRQDIERYMPVPYDLFFRLDVWTTNITTKLQIFEQLGIIFNPSIQLQQNSNILDWTSIFEVWQEDFTFSNRNIPQGSNDERDVMTFKYKVQAWLNPPAKLKRSGLIAEIVTNVFYSTDIQNIEEKIDGTYDIFRSGVAGNPTQIITTEGNYRISVARQGNQDEIMLLTENGAVDDELSWFKLIQIYGQITPNITKIRLKLDPNIDLDTSDIIGSIALDTIRKNVLLFTVDQDTLPVNTLPPITDIIDPTEVFPGSGLPPAAPGQRYLLTSSNSAGEEPAMSPTTTTSPWGNVVAYPNDIIEYNGIGWQVIFNSKNVNEKNYVINNANGIQYAFDQGEWTYTYYGTYSPGYWRIDGIINTPDGTTINIYE